MTLLFEVEDLFVNVNGEEILKGVNLEIPDGEVHALFGPNGSGKTTLMMTIMGFSGYEVTRGEIRFDGKSILGLSLSERARLGMGIAQQRPPTIQGVSLQSMLDYTTTTFTQNGHDLDQLVGLAQMQGFLQRSINDGLSGGEIRRSEILQLLTMNPRFAMMDEPDSGVDMEALQRVGNLAALVYTDYTSAMKKRRSGLLITHTGQLLEFIRPDRAHVLINGQVVGCGDAYQILDTVRQCGYSNCLECPNYLEREGV